MEPNQETKQNQDNINGTVDAVPTPSVDSVEKMEAVAAPRMFDLLKEGWKFLLIRTDLAAWYVALLTGIAILSSPFVMQDGGITSFAAMIGSFVMMIFLAINTWAIIYAVSQDDAYATSYKDAFNWSSKNFFALLWISILSGVAIMLGFVLLIIPGIIVSVYLYFSLYAFAMGSDGGVQALKRSYHDVKGRWWTVAGQLLALILWIFLIYLVAAVAYSILSAFAGEGSVSTQVAEVVVQGAMNGVVGVMSMYALAHYYKYLRATKR